MEKNIDMNDLKRRMDGAVSALRQELSGLRTGRASVNLLDSIRVDAYGAITPLNQVAGVSVPEARMLSVNVWDQNLVGAVERAIRESSLGLNPMTEGNVLRLPIPELNEERRQELTKVSSKYSEGAKIAIRNVRRDGMDTVKKAEKDGESKDDARHISDEIQKLTDGYIKKIDELVQAKEQEIMQV